MLKEAKHWWEVNGREFQESCPIPIDILYGIGSPNEDELQLIGPVAGKHILEIGCGGAQASIAFAKRGAIVTGIDVAESEIALLCQRVGKEEQCCHRIITARYGRFNTHRHTEPGYCLFGLRLSLRR